MAEYKLSKNLWIAKIVPYLINKFIDGIHSNPIYNLRLTCKYFYADVFTDDYCKLILMYLGAEHVAPIKFIQHGQLIPSINMYIREITLIAKIKRGRKYGLEQASKKNQIYILHLWNLGKIKLNETYGKNAIGVASSNGYIDVLQW